MSRKKPPFVTQQLRNAANIYEQRNALYGDNYHHFGNAMIAMFPRGITIRSVEDWNRIGILVQMAAKLTRYGQQFTAGGHVDSLDDLSVYSQMLQELDRSVEAKNIELDL